MRFKFVETHMRIDPFDAETVYDRLATTHIPALDDGPHIEWDADRLEACIEAMADLQVALLESGSVEFNSAYPDETVMFRVWSLSQFLDDLDLGPVVSGDVIALHDALATERFKRTNWANGADNWEGWTPVVLLFDLPRNLGITYSEFSVLYHRMCGRSTEDIAARFDSQRMYFISGAEEELDRRNATGFKSVEEAIRSLNALAQADPTIPFYFEIDQRIKNGEPSLASEYTDNK